MRKLPFTLILLTICSICKAQLFSRINLPYQPYHAENSYKVIDETVDKDLKTISFVFGLGAGYIGSKLYDDPKVEDTHGYVSLQQHQRIKTGITLGIAYTAKYTTLNTPSEDGADIKKHIVPYGWTVAGFINPTGVSDVSSSQSLWNFVNLGVGFGRRTISGFSFMATIDFYGVQQPREWFLNEYANNKTPYTLNGALQKSVDSSDTNIFVNKVFPVWGFKMCYSIDIIKQFKEQ